MKKILGGKNGNLRCECGNLRYPKCELCPSCYYGRHKWWAFKGYYEVVMWSNGETDIGCDVYGITWASSKSHALAKYSNEVQWVVPENIAEFKTKAGAEAWIKQNVDLNKYRQLGAGAQNSSFSRLR